MCKDCGFAYDLLKARFGARRADYLLWNETAFPFSDGQETLRQAREIIAHFDAKATA